MLKNFFKYQSLGNDFVLFDWYKKPETYVAKTLSDNGLRDFITQVCKQHFGVGADGVLILKGNTSAGVPEMLIFNKDGSPAEICLNGLRCVTQHIFLHYNSSEQFKIKIGPRLIECFVQPIKNDPNKVDVKNLIGKIEYYGPKTVSISAENISGHVASIGNPHFIVFQEKGLDWLEAHGGEIECHKEFPNKTNVEFVWPEKGSFPHKIFRANVFERGCGITLACSSGATCIAGTLFKLGQVNKNEKFEIIMPGGTVSCILDDSENVILSAPSTFVFSGILGNK
jgi:diaminopimelate epimerase